jgi:hypothetical protein
MAEAARTVKGAVGRTNTQERLAGKKNYLRPGLRSLRPRLRSKLSQKPVLELDDRRARHSICPLIDNFAAVARGQGPIDGRVDRRLDRVD